MGFCYNCNKRKPDDYFPLLSKPAKDGRKISVWCLQCSDQESLLWIATNRKIDRFMYLNQYKLGRYLNTRIQRYKKLWHKQGGRCAICRKWPKSRPLNVDHDHNTGKVRGLLCTRCNTQLGKWRDIPPVNETQFIQYLSHD